MNVSFSLFNLKCILFPCLRCGFLEFWIEWFLHFWYFKALRVLFAATTTMTNATSNGGDKELRWVEFYLTQMHVALFSFWPNSVLEGAFSRLQRGGDVSLRPPSSAVETRIWGHPPTSFKAMMFGYKVSFWFSYTYCHLSLDCMIGIEFQFNFFI